MSETDSVVRLASPSRAIGQKKKKRSRGARYQGTRGRGRGGAFFSLPDAASALSVSSMSSPMHSPRIMASILTHGWYLSNRAVASCPSDSRKQPPPGGEWGEGCQPAIK